MESIVGNHASSEGGELSYSVCECRKTDLQGFLSREQLSDETVDYRWIVFGTSESKIQERKIRHLVAVKECSDSSKEYEVLLSVKPPRRPLGSDGRFYNHGDYVERVTNRDQLRAALVKAERLTVMGSLIDSSFFEEARRLIGDNYSTSELDLRKWEEGSAEQCGLWVNFNSTPPTAHLLLFAKKEGRELYASDFINWPSADWKTIRPSVIMQLNRKVVAIFQNLEANLYGH